MTHVINEEGWEIDEIITSMYSNEVTQMNYRIGGYMLEGV